VHGGGGVDFDGVVHGGSVEGWIGRQEIRRRGVWLFRLENFGGGLLDLVGHGAEALDHRADFVGVADQVLQPVLFDQERLGLEDRAADFRPIAKR